MEEVTVALSAFSHEAFNTAPHHGSWTPGQIAEHLLIFERRALSILSSPAAPLDRDSEEKTAAIRLRLENRGQVIEAPSFLLPSDAAKDRDDIVAELKTARDGLVAFIETHDIRVLYPEMPHRLFGVLSGYEWMHLIMLHAKRHIMQLEAMG